MGAVSKKKALERKLLSLESKPMTKLANHRAEICCNIFQKSELKLIIGVFHIFFHITVSKKSQNDIKYHYRENIDNI